jgi:hypothetical protein
MDSVKGAMMDRMTQEQIDEEIRKADEIIRGLTVDELSLCRQADEIYREWQKAQLSEYCCRGYGLPPNRIACRLDPIRKALGQEKYDAAVTRAHFEACDKWRKVQEFENACPPCACCGATPIYDPELNSDCLDEQGNVVRAGPCLCSECDSKLFAMERR